MLFYFINFFRVMKKAIAYLIPFMEIEKAAALLADPLMKQSNII